MNHISTKKLGLALGITGTLLYTGCATVMLLAGHDGSITFFNNILHGLDVSSIVRMDISLADALIGLVQTFILSWLVGACIAVIYNISFNSTK
jgi:hypothetical protein